MAMYFIGANYDGMDVLPKFLENQGVFIGYDDPDHYPLLTLLNRISIGDLVVIKAYSPSNGLYIKAVGMCMSHEQLRHPALGRGRHVKWLWNGNEKLGTFDDHYTNMRTGTIYEELNHDILKMVATLATHSLVKVI